MDKDNIVCTSEEADEEEELSRCCGAPLYEDTDICTECKEHN